MPLLGDIPILGFFFRHTKKEIVRLDLVIEMSCRVVGDDEATGPTAEMISPELNAEFADELPAIEE